LKFSLLERFRQQCRAADRPDQAAILKLLLELQTALATPHQHRGLGLRKLHSSGIWEVRVGRSLRALFRLADDEAIFVFLGTHDEVKKFLKSL
jgi:mRNA-degrading endonuclease RelE of RelBE toxin-antitoxin system